MVLQSSAEPTPDNPDLLAVRTPVFFAVMDALDPGKGFPRRRRVAERNRAVFNEILGNLVFNTGKVAISADDLATLSGVQLNEAMLAVGYMLRMAVLVDARAQALPCDTEDALFHAFMLFQDGEVYLNPAIAWFGTKEGLHRKVGPVDAVFRPLVG